MKKYLQLVVLSIISQLPSLNAQTLFNGPDTVCVRQPVKLTSNIFNASSYYWGFCSGSIMNAPTGVNMGSSFSFHTPSAIDIRKDKDGNYYGFVANAGSYEFLRLNYGKSLNNVPTVTNFGNLTNGLPIHPTSLYVVYDTANAKWFVFVSGGYTAAESSLARLDFGPTLSNPTPNIANFGNLGGLFNGPKGIFIDKESDNKWYGYMVNRYTNELIRMDFLYNVSNTPQVVQSLGNPGGALNFPTDMAAVKDNGNWYFFVTNRGNNTVSRINMGPSLNTTIPTGTNMGDFLFRILVPSSISIIKDCGNIFAYVTDSTTSQLVSIQMPSALGPYNSVDYSIVGGMNFPSSISSIMRDRDNLYAFVTNVYDSTLTKINISHCTNASIPSFSEVTPPTFSYNAPGVYNVYYAINEGLPNMQVECKEITVLPIPNIFINANPFPTICKGDSIKLYAISNFADSFEWSPIYHIDTAYNHTDTVKAWPDYTTTYNVHIFYPDGCIVDTFITVNVIKINADAGPDRTILDGSMSTLGGPYTSLDNGNYTYRWAPYQFIDDTTTSFPVVNPPYDYTYYFEVTEFNSGLGCKARDTVVVHVNCGDFYLPNAFAPGSSNPGSNTFGILNKEIASINYFRIYNRWGVLVFETTVASQMWDGTYKNTPCPTGVYVWEADGFCTSGKPIKKKGNVSLLR